MSAKRPLTLTKKALPVGVKFRFSRLLLTENPPVDPDFKPKWPVLVLTEIGDMADMYPPLRKAA